MAKTLADYLAMQRATYNDPAASVEGLVGSYDFQENFPYETNFLFEYGDIRKPLFPDPSKLIAFDIGCGEGRMVRRMEKFFARCDGGDISTKMIEAARIRSSPSSIFFVTDGTNCGDAASNAYDFVFCTVSLQHIGSYTIRSKIIADIVRILKPDGKMTLQLLFSEPFPFVSGRIRAINKNRHVSFLTEVFIQNPHSAGWFEDRFDAAGTNSLCDGVFGTDQIQQVTDDFKKYFEYVSMWFHDISIGRAGADEPRQLPMTHPNSHLFDTYPGTHFVFVHGGVPKKY